MRVPFGPPKETPEFVSTICGRMTCWSCGEWIYKVRRADSSDPFAFPAECQVCGAEVPNTGDRPE